MEPGDLILLIVFSHCIKSISAPWLPCLHRWLMMQWNKKRKELRNEGLSLYRNASKHRLHQAKGALSGRSCPEQGWSLKDSSLAIRLGFLCAHQRSGRRQLSVVHPSSLCLWSVHTNYTRCSLASLREKKWIGASCNHRFSPEHAAQAGFAVDHGKWWIPWIIPLAILPQFLQQVFVWTNSKEEY